MANVADIKKELQLLGISTATPGLVGEERYEELKSRLEEAQSEHHKSQQLEVGSTITKSTQHSIAHESLGHLSIAELRSRLNSLGISTATPGLIGEDRWNELMKRLMVAICGTEETSHQNTESKENANTMQQNISKSRKPPVSARLQIRFVNLSLINTKGRRLRGTGKKTSRRKFPSTRNA